MKERPVIFNGEMVRAILDGRKTQTRRTVSDRHLHLINVASQVGECYPLGSGIDHANSQSYYREHCPFGQVGDRLWVREKTLMFSQRDGRACVRYLADNTRSTVDFPSRLKPVAIGRCLPNGCYREASRITLEITAVRVERLNSISEEDAKDEGVGSAIWFAAKGVPEDEWVSLGKRGAIESSHINQFATLWESIYGGESWSANPWVWVIEFKRVGGSDASK